MKSTNQADIYRRAIEHYCSVLQLDLNQIADEAGVSAERLKGFMDGIDGALTYNDGMRLSPLLREMVDAEKLTLDQWKARPTGKKPSTVLDVI